MAIQSKISVFITGADGGIGYETVKALIQSPISYHIFLGTSILENGNIAADILRKHFPNSKSTIQVVQVDVASDNSIVAAFETVEQYSDHLDVLVNNTGTPLENNTQLTTREAWNQMLDVNVTGPQIMSETFAPLLIKSQNPRLIFLSNGGSSQLETDKNCSVGWSTENELTPTSLEPTSQFEITSKSSDPLPVGWPIETPLQPIPIKPTAAAKPGIMSKEVVDSNELAVQMPSLKLGAISEPESISKPIIDEQSTEVGSRSSIQVESTSKTSDPEGGWPVETPLQPPTELENMTKPDSLLPDGWPIETPVKPPAPFRLTIEGEVMSKSEPEPEGWPIETPLKPPGFKPTIQSEIMSKSGSRPEGWPIETPIKPPAPFKPTVQSEIMSKPESGPEGWPIETPLKPPGFKPTIQSEIMSKSGSRPEGWPIETPLKPPGFKPTIQSEVMSKPGPRPEGWPIETSIKPNPLKPIIKLEIMSKPEAGPEGWPIETPANPPPFKPTALLNPHGLPTRALLKPNSYESATNTLNMMMLASYWNLKEIGVQVWSISPGYLATNLDNSQNNLTSLVAGDAPISGNMMRSVIEGERDA